MSGHGPRALALAAVVVLGGCGEDEAEPTGGGGTAEACPAPNRLMSDGRCLEPGVQDDGCPAGSFGLADGTCQAAGIPPELCGEGFAPTGDGSCAAVLPAAPCPPGTMALPGETECRDVMPCGSGPWGDIPVDSTTVYVDQSHGGPFTGTATAPFATIGDAVASAPAGGLIAVASGTYVEDVLIHDQPVRLWGKCPQQVEVVGSNDSVGAIDLRSDGAEIHGLAVTGARVGVAITNATGVVVSQLWVHDTGRAGIDIEDALGPASATVTSLLIEGAHNVGLFVGGGEATIEQIAVRDTSPLSASTYRGNGIAVMASATGRGTATVRASVFEQSHDMGFFVSDSDVVAEAIVVRDTLPSAAAPERGQGLFVGNDPAAPGRGSCELRFAVIERGYRAGIEVFASDFTAESVTVRDIAPQQSDGLYGYGVHFASDVERSVGTLRAAVAERSHDMGVFVLGSDALLEGVVVRDTAPGGIPEGRGIGVQNEDLLGQPATATIHGCVLERNMGVSLFSSGAAVDIDGLWVRDTYPDLLGMGGRGIGIQGGSGLEPPTVRLSGSLVENNRDIGVFAAGCHLEVAGVLVRNTLPRDADLSSGRGMGLQNTSGLLAVTSVRHSLLTQSHEIGLFAAASSVTLEGVVIDGTAPRPADDLFGDGLAVASENEQNVATVTGCRMVDNRRAGIAVFGATATVSDTAIECNHLDLASETYLGMPASVIDAGGNRCFCGATEVQCKALSAGLEPPEPLDGN